MFDVRSIVQSFVCSFIRSCHHHNSRVGVSTINVKLSKCYGMCIITPPPHLPLILMSNIEPTNQPTKDERINKHTTQTNKNIIHPNDNIIHNATLRTLFNLRFSEPGKISNNHSRALHIQQQLEHFPTTSMSPCHTKYWPWQTC